MEIERSLRINKGEYILNFNEGLVLKLIVDYWNKKYSWKWILKKDSDNNEIESMLKYAKDFAERMIQSKSERNFYQ